jgi:hypothetical protein
LEPLEDRVLLSGLQGVVFNDLNGDGVRGPGEPGIAGRTVFLDLDHDGKLDPGEQKTVTAADGTFSFADTGPGTYNVVQLLPAGWSTSAVSVPASSASAADRLIRLDQVRSDSRFAGIDGSGYSVAVIDTGIDASHPYLNGAVLYQHDYVNNDDVADDTAGHGTSVASLIASRDPAHPGVAPGAGLIALKALDDTSGDFNNIEASLRWVIDNADKYNIVSVNLSLGDGGNYDTPLSLYDIGDELSTLSQMGIVVVAAAGNSHGPQQPLSGLAYPAADPNVLAVGAVWDTDHGGAWQWANGAIDQTTGPDRITSFSQRAAPGETEVFAPGTMLVAAAPGGGTATLSGTSMSAGIVAGLVPLVQQLAVKSLGHKLSVQEFRTLVQQSGAPIVDGDDENDNVANTGATYRRVDAESLLESVIGTGGIGAGLVPNSTIVHVTADGDTTGIELGSQRPGRVRGVVYNDLDGDGKRDNNEPGLAGRIVFLDDNQDGRLGANEKWAVTDSQGAYSLDNVPIGPTLVRALPQGGDVVPDGTPLMVTSAMDRGLDFGVRAGSPTGSAPTVPANLPTLTGLKNDTNPPGVKASAVLGGGNFGIGIVGSQGSGRWEYSTNGGANWTNLYTPTTRGARLLRADDMVRFVPAANWTGTATLNYYVWNQTGGSSGGSMSVEGRTGGSGAFSATSATSKWVVAQPSGGNDAPVLNGPGTLPTAVSTGDNWPVVRVGDLLAGLVSDSGGTANVGIAVEGFTGDGRWQFSRDNGKSYSDIGPLAAGSVRLLEAGALVRFVAFKGTAGQATITYRAWDRSTGRDGVIDTLSANVGGSSAFSLKKVTATMEVRQPA